MHLFISMAPEKVFLEVARKLLEFTPAHIWRLEQHIAPRRDLGWGLGAPAPREVQGQRPGVQNV